VGFCTYCGSQLENMAKFCTKCGKKVLPPLDAVKIQPQEIRCGCCGAEMSPNKRFCTKCGTRLFTAEEGNQNGMKFGNAAAVAAAGVGAGIMMGNMTAQAAGTETSAAMTQATPGMGDMATQMGGAVPPDAGASLSAGLSNLGGEAKKVLNKINNDEELKQDINDAVDSVSETVSDAADSVSEAASSLGDTLSDIFDLFS